VITALIIAMAVILGLIGGWVYAGFPLPQRRPSTVGLPSRAAYRPEEVVT